MKNLKKLNIENYVSENGTNFDIELSYEVFGKPLGKAPIVLVNHALTGIQLLVEKMVGGVQLLEMKN
jgi:homoserine O-acetyltransferase